MGLDSHIMPNRILVQAMPPSTGMCVGISLRPRADEASFPPRCVSPLPSSSKDQMSSILLQVHLCRWAKHNTAHKTGHRLGCRCEECFGSQAYYCVEAA